MWVFSLIIYTNWFIVKITKKTFYLNVQTSELVFYSLILSMIIIIYIYIYVTFFFFFFS